MKMANPTGGRRPSRFLGSSDFLHCDKLLIVGPAEQAADLLSYLHATAGGVVEGVLAGDIREKVWGGIKEKIMAHLLDDYRSRIG